jgi:DNA gyrase subunit A
MIVTDVDIRDIIKDCIETYGTYVLEDRHIPDFRDGLKPVQRRVLWTMNEDGHVPGSRFTKCSAIVGDTMARYHPHGDSSIYGALVNMTGIPRKDSKKILYGPNFPYPLV